MGRKSNTVLFMVCINLFGLTRTIDEFKHKRNLRWFLLFAFGFMFVVIGGIGIIELLRASDILIKIEELKEQIKAFDVNITETKKQKQAVLNIIRRTKINVLEVSCMRKGFAFRREGFICLKRELKEDNYTTSLVKCGQWKSDSLLIIDTKDKLKMMQTEFPFDRVVTLDNIEDSIYWVAGSKVKGQWKYPNDSIIPPEFTVETGPSIQNGCLAVSKSSNFKLTAHDCNENFFAICEIFMSYVKDDYETQ